MFITSDLLFRIPVETTEGEYLGKVVGLEIDVETQSILRYRVRPSKIVAHVLRNDDLVVHRGQVVAMTEERMVVEGGGIKDYTEEKSAHVHEMRPLASPGMTASKS